MKKLHKIVVSAAMAGTLLISTAQAATLPHTVVPGDTMWKLAVKYQVGTREIISANLTVCRMILNRKETVEPVIIRVRTNLKTETARVILANSITLTPGTITVSMTDDYLLVHCLDKSLSEGIEDSVFVRLLKKMEED